MNDLDLLDKRIENYIHKRMTDEERESFEEELRTNEDLRKNIKMLITIVELYNAELFQLKKKLDDAEAELQQQQFFDKT